ncbi:bifunctional hydroxymethylpyrimidine kinase/phosphomethylpyrimidine kinase [Acidisoma silvae]|uniref:hydroxymethylpyrimidine kinase n=1 Tax=Acidisoma silvae TaxID=2802396 RepID=A0A963YW06_9PROT|nr:bifunctional hydroxymethylpyrimidine kinase/phosphomethylpyrimidine kinase [Acidisoma silvae]MCB8878242.1 bifunctional hydroxymethylpyrimidine kinase/phosphomethylpyrimidine kinase [Acidisoma silvae]
MRVIPNILTIAGTDPTGGAGIQADIKTFSAFGTYAMSVITAVVAQNTQGVRAFVELAPHFVAQQIDAVFEDVRVDAVKIGMIATAGIAEIVADRLHYHGANNIVLDPVMIAKSGDHLLRPDAVAAIRDHLAPLSTVITPNLPEAGVLLGLEPARDVEEMRRQLQTLRALGSEWVMLKGGHMMDDAQSTDMLLGAGEILELHAPRVKTLNDHGTGCTLSAAIASMLPTHSVEDAVRGAKNYVQQALVQSGQLDVGRGHGPLHHFHGIW